MNFDVCYITCIYKVVNESVKEILIGIHYGGTGVGRVANITTALVAYAATCSLFVAKKVMLFISVVNKLCAQTTI